MKRKEDNNIIIINKQNKDNDIVVVTEEKSDAEYLKEILSKNLKRYMDKKGKNATDLSKELDIKYSTVRDWCNAKNYPRVDKIQLLANYSNSIFLAPRVLTVKYN